jgi:aminoglycoside phosphotransferase (APT) family kinase protein
VSAFTSQSTHQTLIHGCLLAKPPIPSHGAELVRLGENAVFRLPSAGLIARVARSSARARVAQREVSVAHWLQDQGLPVAAPAKEAPTPIIVDQRVVTFWEEITDPSPSAPHELGRALRQLHACPVPAHLDLASVAPLAGVRERIAGAELLTDDDRGFLNRLVGSLDVAFTPAEPGSPTVVVHGDAHVDNLIRGTDGRLAWVDLEGVALGYPEWDLVLTAIERDCGWISDAGYADFTTAYGTDVTQSPCYPVVRQIRLVRMTSWLTQKMGEGQVVQDEVRRRIADLRTGGPIRGWRAF